MNKEVLSHDVIDLIEKSKNEGFSEKELKNISMTMKGLSEEELIIVKQHIETKITEGSKSKLLGLTNSIEYLNNLPYGFEGIIEGNESEFFIEMFDSESRKIAIGAGINNLLTENLPPEIISGLGMNQKETIQLLIWNKVVSKIGFMSGGGYMMEKGLEKFTGIIDSTKSVVSKSSEVAQSEDFDITKLGEIFDKIQTIFESNDKDKEKKGNKLLSEVTKYFTYLTKDYFIKLNNVFTLAKENNLEKNSDFLHLLDNPIIMNELLEKGEYKKNGIEIDLNKKIILGLEKNTTNEADKKIFMKEIVQNTNNTGNRIDGLKHKVDQIAGLFVKFGFDSNELKKFQNDVKEIPLVGELLSYIMGFFLGDKVYNAIDKIYDSQKYKSVIEKAQVFFIKEDNTLPFIKTEKLEKKDGSNIEKFVKSVEFFEKELAGDKKIEKSIIFEDNFWEIVFSNKESEHSIYKEIQNKIKELNPNNDTFSQEDYFVTLSKIKFSKINEQVQEKTQEPSNPSNNSLKKESTIKQDEGESKKDITQLISENSKDGKEDIILDKKIVGGLTGTGVAASLDKNNKIENINIKKEEIIEPTSELIDINIPLEEQLTNIERFPKDISIDGKIISIDIGSDKKSIILGDKSYNVTVKQGPQDILESIQLDDGKVSVTANLTLTTLTKKLEPSQLTEVFKDILLKNSYEKLIDGGFKLKIS